jgi:hypothetical protein
VPESKADTMTRTLGARGAQGQTYDLGYVAPHPGMSQAPIASSAPTSHVTPEGGAASSIEAGYLHATYDLAYLESIKPTHLPPRTVNAPDGANIVPFANIVP